MRKHSFIKRKIREIQEKDSKLQKRILWALIRHKILRFSGSYTKKGLTFKEIFCGIQCLPNFIIFKENKRGISYIKPSKNYRMMGIWHAYGGAHNDLWNLYKHKIQENMNDGKIADTILSISNHRRESKDYSEENEPLIKPYFPYLYNSNKANTILKRSINKLIKRGKIIKSDRFDATSNKKIEIFLIPKFSIIEEDLMSELMDRNFYKNEEFIFDSYF